MDDYGRVAIVAFCLIALIAVGVAIHVARRMP